MPGDNAIYYLHLSLLKADDLKVLLANKFKVY